MNCASAVSVTMAEIAVVAAAHELVHRRLAFDGFVAVFIWPKGLSFWLLQICFAVVFVLTWQLTICRRYGQLLFSVLFYPVMYCFLQMLL